MVRKSKYNYSFGEMVIYSKDRNKFSQVVDFIIRLDFFTKILNKDFKKSKIFKKNILLTWYNLVNYDRYFLGGHITSANISDISQLENMILESNLENKIAILGEKG